MLQPTLQRPADRPLLVLLPGMEGTGLMFDPFLRALAGFETRVVRYPVDLTSYPDCVRFARAALPQDRPFLLLGESFSGPVALALAAERPAGLRGLALCSTFARNPRPALAWMAPLLRALPARGLPRSVVRRLMLGRRPTGPLTALVDALLPQVPAETLKGRLLAVLAVDQTALLARIQVPVLALCASQDRLVPPAALRWMQAHLPGLEIVTLPGPHWLLQTRPAAAAQTLTAFLERLLPADRPTRGPEVPSPAARTPDR